MLRFEIPSQFRFSLRGMLIAVAIVAVLIWLSTAVAGLLFWVTWFALYLVVPTPIVIAAVYARGDFQAFAVGALLPWVASWSGAGPRGGNLLGLIASAVLLAAMGGICGVVAVASRRWLDRSAHR
jgi:hypothetical protein